MPGPKTGMFTTHRSEHRTFHIIWYLYCAGDGQEVSCGTCLCDVARAEATAMDCGHLFCNDCWGQHLSIQIVDGAARRLPCMGIKCGVICDEVKARSALAQGMCPATWKPFALWWNQRLHTPH